MNKAILLHLLSQITCTYEQGIWVELKQWVDWQNQIKKHRLHITRDDLFVLVIQPGEFTYIEIEKLFSSLLSFIRYSTGAFYFQTMQEDCIDYWLVFWMDNNTGFALKCIFADDLESYLKTDSYVNLFN